MTLNYKNLYWSSLVLKLGIALMLPLTMDEYYYFLWGKNLSLSYFDHPPMVGWLMLFSQPLASLAEGAIRWPFILMSHGTLFLWDLILRPFFSEKRRITFLLIGLLNPLWGWGAFIATPDVPLVFFWSLALFFVHRVLQNDRWRDYVGLATALGLGFLSKYHVALFLPCLLLMLWQQKQLYKLLRPKAWAAVGLALLICSPVFIWNAQHDWVSIDFQWKHGMSSKYWKWTLPIEYLFGQIFIIFPVFLAFLVRGNKDWRMHWLTPFALFPFVFFLYSSFKGRVEANWVIMSVPCLLALSAIFSNNEVWVWGKRTVYLWAALFVMALGLVAFKDSLPTNKIKLFERDRYKSLIEVARENENVYAYSYQLASFLSFETGKMVCKLPGYGRPDHFQFFRECQDYPRGFFYITEHNDRRDFSKDFKGLEAKKEKKIGTEFKWVKVGQQ